MFFHCVSGEMSIFVSQEAFTNMHVNRPAAELDIDTFLGVSVPPCRVKEVYYVFSFKIH